MSKLQITAVANYFRWITFQHRPRLLIHDNICSGSSFVEHFFFVFSYVFGIYKGLRVGVQSVKRDLPFWEWSRMQTSALSTDSAMSKTNKKQHLLHSLWSFFFLFLQDVGNHRSPKLLLLCSSNNVYPFTTPPSFYSDTHLHNIDK